MNENIESNRNQPNTNNKIMAQQAETGDTHTSQGAAMEVEGEVSNSQYSDVAAKTVANIRRLQENVMSVNVTSPPPCQTSPKGANCESNAQAAFSTRKEPTEQSKNVSTISVNKAPPEYSSSRSQTTPPTSKTTY